MNSPKPDTFSLTHLNTRRRPNQNSEDTVPARPRHDGFRAEERMDENMPAPPRSEHLARIGDPVPHGGSATALVAVANEVVRHGIVSLLREVPVVTRLWTCVSADEAVMLLDLHRPDVVLCRSDETGNELAPEAALRGAQVLLLLEDLRLESVRDAVMLSAHGFLLQEEVTADALREAVERLAAGQMSLPDGVARALMARTSPARPTRPVAAGGLSAREGEVLGLLARGLSNKQIARRLEISEHGVKRHVGNVLAKLNVPNRTCAVAVALQDGLIASEEP